ncbi:MAG: L-seryl-tRNA(Ser) seleniumtransferase [Gammaproteobacteria bacterium]
MLTVRRVTMPQDRLGNEFAPDVPYARGRILTNAADDLVKVAAAQRHMRSLRDAGKPVYLLSGLERRLDAHADDIPMMDDELAGAFYGEQLRERGLEHLGGDPARHDVILTNRLTAALLVAADVMIQPGDVVLGVSPRYSHPAVARAVAHGGGVFHDCAGVAAFRRELESREKVDLVFITRLAVSYEILDLKDLQTVVNLAAERGLRTIVDDAGGARVGPAVFEQPRTLELGVTVGATGLDKYGTTGPRVGLLGGDHELIARMRIRAFEMGLEARQMLYPAVVRSIEGYSAQKVRDRVAATQGVADALKTRISANRLFETPVTVQLRAEDILELAQERAGVDSAPIVPYEATAALAMLMLRDHGIMTVHFAGIPPGTSAMMIKFLSPEILQELGGAERFAEALDQSLDSLAGMLGDEASLRSLILGH